MRDDVGRPEARDEVGVALGLFAHDLAAELRLVHARVSLVETQMRDADLSRDLRSGRLHLERVLQRVDAQLIARRLDRGQFSARRHILSLHELAAEARDAAEWCSLDGREVALDVRPLPEAQVVADSVLTRIVFHELVENAGRYARGESRTMVRMRALTDGPNVRTRISDRGPGVPADERAAIFENGFRGRGARARVPTGLGRGLWLSRTLCREMGGDLELVESVVGATFEITLPSA